MKWQVCSCSSLSGTEVLGIVEADNESDANQRANEQFRPTWAGEDIIVRPIREKDKKQELLSSAAVKKAADSYVFKVEHGHIYFDSCVKDSLYMVLDRDSAIQLVKQIITDGLGQDKEQFEIAIVGKLELAGEM